MMTLIGTSGVLVWAEFRFAIESPFDACFLDLSVRPVYKTSAFRAIPVSQSCFFYLPCASPSLAAYEEYRTKMAQDPACEKAFRCSKVENYSYESIIIKAVGEAGSTVAGIHAQIGGGWLYIASLWVEENCRKKGLGRKLVGLAEKVAVEKKCHGVYLYTYSFQSPRFYEKLGYGILGTLEKFGG